MTSAEATATVLWQTGPESVPELTMAGVSGVREDQGTLSLAVTLSRVSQQTVTVRYETTDGTAEAGTDYTAVEGDYVAELGTLTLEPGQTSGTIRIELLDDMLAEADETFTMLLSDPTHATLTDAAAMGTIEDDDAAVAQGWLARFGRTVATHAMGAVEGRLTDRTAQSSRATRRQRWRCSLSPYQ